MKFAIAFAYALLPLASLIGGLAMMFSSLAPVAYRAAMMAGGGLALVLSFGALSLVIALQTVELQKVRVRSDRDPR